jgi:hypothetical protein
MKTLLVLLAAVLLVGCKTKIGGEYGFTTEPIVPPQDAAVRITVRNIGLHVGQNAATQTPEAQLGYQSATYDRIPTSTNQVYIAPVRAAIAVKGGFDVSVDENLETGDRVTGKVCEADCSPVRFYWECFYADWRGKWFSVRRERDCWTQAEVALQFAELDARGCQQRVLPGFEAVAFAGDTNARIWVVANRRGKLVRP